MTSDYSATYLVFQSKTPLESFLDPNVDQIRYRSGSGSSNSSNSLKEEFDHEKQAGPTNNKNDRRNTPVIYNHSSHNSTPTTSKGGKGSKNNRRESWGSKNNLSFNGNPGGASRNFFCPFIDCKNYRYRHTLPTFYYIFHILCQYMYFD